MITIKPDISWWWNPRRWRRKLVWLQLQVGVFIDLEPPYCTVGVDLLIVKLGLKVGWGNDSTNETQTT